MDFKIDLHGVKHEDVQRLLDSFIWEHMKKKTPAIQIITGNSPEMKRIVSGIVSEYGLSAEDSFTNTACLNVNLG